ncbi:MAG: hypothetical protein HOQ24_01360 [Mycobacteriaceae bacterium]|nr:hypothetical protein [Mycobacteriaceae bacterium]
MVAGIPAGSVLITQYDSDGAELVAEVLEVEGEAGLVVHFDLVAEVAKVVVTNARSHAVQTEVRGISTSIPPETPTQIPLVGNPDSVKFTF